MKNLLKEIKMSNIKLSQIEKDKLARKFNRRKVSAMLFCKKHKLSKTTIYKWCKKLKDKKKKDNNFIPLEISSDTNSISIMN